MKGLKNISFSTKVLLSLIFGVGIGLFFGDRVSFLATIGDIFIGLLQMTVLPYIMFSLVVNIGRLSMEEGKRLIQSGALSLVILLAIGMVGLLILPLALPEWGGGKFYSDDFIQPSVPFDFVKNYVPANLFESLTDNVVPAVVVFSIFLGLGLMTLKNKEALLVPLDVMTDALNQVNKIVVKITPLGVFAIGGGLVSTLTIGDLSRLQGYLLLYFLSVSLYLFVVLPGLIAVLTPYSPFKVLKKLRPTLITIFATGKIIVVFPQLIENIKEIIAMHNQQDDESDGVVDLIMPLAYPFPNLGTFLIFVFVPFAAWYSGTKLDLSDNYVFLGSTLLSSFVAPITGLPFSLDLLGIDKDTFQLFVVSTVLTDRVRVVLGAFHLVVLTLITLGGVKGILKVNKSRLLMWSALTVVVTFLGIVGLKSTLTKSMASIPTNKDIINQFDIISDQCHIGILDKSARNPRSIRLNEGVLGRVKRIGILRVGYYEYSMPFSFYNSSGELVGYHIDLAYQLADDLNVNIEFVPIRTGNMVSDLKNDHYDIVMSDIFLTHTLASKVPLTDVLIDVSLAVLVKDNESRLNEYKPEAINEPLNIAYFERKDVSEEFQVYFPSSSMYQVDRYQDFFNQSIDSVVLDGLITSAEKAYAYTLFYNGYKVVNPFPNSIKVELVLPVADDQVWKNYVNSWIKFRRSDGTFDKIYNQWVLGKEHIVVSKTWNVLDDVIRFNKPVLEDSIPD